MASPLGVVSVQLAILDSQNQSLAVCLRSWHACIPMPTPPWLGISPVIEGGWSTYLRGSWVTGNHAAEHRFLRPRHPESRPGRWCPRHNPTKDEGSNNSSSSASHSPVRTCALELFPAPMICQLFFCSGSDGMRARTGTGAQTEGGSGAARIACPGASDWRLGQQDGD